MGGRVGRRAGERERRKQNNRQSMDYFQQLQRYFARVFCFSQMGILLLADEYFAFMDRWTDFLLIADESFAS